MEKLNLKPLYDYAESELPSELVLKLSEQKTDSTGYKPNSFICPFCGEMEVIVFNKLTLKCMECEAQFGMSNVEIV